MTQEVPKYSADIDSVQGEELPALGGQHSSTLHFEPRAGLLTILDLKKEFLVDFNERTFFATNANMMFIAIF